MMHLALELHCTVAELESRMSVAELTMWSQFHRSLLLPQRRLEYQLAHVALTIANTMGSAKRRLGLQDFLLFKDFLLDRGPVKDDDGADDPIDIAATPFAGASSRGVYRLGQGRKKVA